MKYNIKELSSTTIQEAILDAHNIEDDEMNIVKATIVNNEIELAVETISRNNDTDEITIVNNIDNIVNAIKITEGIIIEIPKQNYIYPTEWLIEDYMRFNDIEDEEFEIDDEELKEFGKDFTDDMIVQNTDSWLDDNEDEIDKAIQLYIAIQNNKAEAVCEG
jgi:hypothetical protein